MYNIIIKDTSQVKIEAILGVPLPPFADKGFYRVVDLHIPYGIGHPLGKTLKINVELMR